MFICAMCGHESGTRCGHHELQAQIGDLVEERSKLTLKIGELQKQLRQEAAITSDMDALRARATTAERLNHEYKTALEQIATLAIEFSDCDQEKCPAWTLQRDAKRALMEKPKGEHPCICADFILEESICSKCGGYIGKPKDDPACTSVFEGNQCSLKMSHVSKGTPHMFLHYQNEQGGIQWPLEKRIEEPPKNHA